jgi:hypothetical protein
MDNLHFSYDMLNEVTERNEPLQGGETEHEADAT